MKLYDLIFESPAYIEETAPPGMEGLVLKLKKQYPEDHSKAFATAWKIYNQKQNRAKNRKKD